MPTLTLTSILININAYNLHDSAVVDVAMMQLCHQFLALTSTLINVNAHDPCDSVAFAVAAI
jgi:hypothetical protein